MSGKKDLAFYLKLPYRIDCKHCKDSDGTRYWLAEYPDIMGCSTDGATRIEAVNNVKELFKEMVEVILDSGNDVPIPKKTKPEALKEISVEPTQSIPVYFSPITFVKSISDKPSKKKSDMPESSDTSGIFRSKKSINMADGIPA